MMKACSKQPNVSLVKAHGRTYAIVEASSLFSIGPGLFDNFCCYSVYVCPFGQNKHCVCIAGFRCGGELSYGGVLRPLAGVTPKVNIIKQKMLRKILKVKIMK